MQSDFPSSTARPDPAHPVIFFDGVCGLCNAFVDFAMARDKRARFRFSPLQGETFAALHVPAAPAQDSPGHARISDAEGLRSIVLLDREGMYRKSDAAIRVMAGLGGIWNLARPLRLVPRFLRDGVYDIIAANRYRWFGKREACRLPTPAERDRFLP